MKKYHYFISGSENDSWKSNAKRTAPKMTRRLSMQNTHKRKTKTRKCLILPRLVEVLTYTTPNAIFTVFNDIKWSLSYPVLSMAIVISGCSIGTVWAHLNYMTQHMRGVMCSHWKKKIICTWEVGNPSLFLGDGRFLTVMTLYNCLTHWDLGPFYQRWLTLIPAWINTIRRLKCDMELLIHS